MRNIKLPKALFDFYFTAVNVNPTGNKKPRQNAAFFERGLKLDFGLLKSRNVAL